VPDLGKKMDYLEYEKGDTVYTNAIKVPGSFPGGEIYFYFRKINRSVDDKLIFPDPAQIRSFDVIPYDVPIQVITVYSTDGCP
jgi:hypothetical protein